MSGGASGTSNFSFLSYEKRDEVCDWYCWLYLTMKGRFKCIALWDTVSHAMCFNTFAKCTSGHNPSIQKIWMPWSVDTVLTMHTEKKNSSTLFQTCFWNAPVSSLWCGLAGSLCECLLFEREDDLQPAVFIYFHTLRSTSFTSRWPCGQAQLWISSFLQWWKAKNCQWWRWPHIASPCSSSRLLSNVLILMMMFIYRSSCGFVALWHY